MSELASRLAGWRAAATLTPAPTAANVLNTMCALLCPTCVRKRGQQHTGHDVQQRGLGGLEHIHHHNCGGQASDVAGKGAAAGREGGREEASMKAGGERSS